MNDGAASTDHHTISRRMTQVIRKLTCFGLRVGGRLRLIYTTYAVARLYAFGRVVLFNCISFLRSPAQKRNTEKGEVPLLFIRDLWLRRVWRSHKSRRLRKYYAAAS